MQGLSILLIALASVTQVQAGFKVRQTTTITTVMGPTPGGGGKAVSGTSGTWDIVPADLSGRRKLISGGDKVAIGVVTNADEIVGLQKAACPESSDWGQHWDQCSQAGLGIVRFTNKGGNEHFDIRDGPDGYGVFRPDSDEKLGDCTRLEGDAVDVGHHFWQMITSTFVNVLVECNFDVPN